MVFGGRFLKQNKRIVRKRWTSATVDHHFRECDLGICHAGVGCSLEPGSSGLEIGRYAAALGKHSPIHKLRLRHTFGGAAQPFCRALLVRLDANALDQTKAEIERRRKVAGKGGLFEPFCDARWIIRSCNAL
jgi:hypothetical protein